jgi:hypothetical protein
MNTIGPYHLILLAYRLERPINSRTADTSRLSPKGFAKNLSCSPKV